MRIPQKLWQRHLTICGSGTAAKHRQYNAVAAAPFELHVHCGRSGIGGKLDGLEKLDNVPDEESSRWARCYLTNEDLLRLPSLWILSGRLTEISID